MTTLNRPDGVGLVRAQRLSLTTPGQAFFTSCGRKLDALEVEFETYGQMTPAGDNVILITHGFSADAHAAGWDPLASPAYRPWRVGQPGWWHWMIGPGRWIDTRRFYVISSNVLGSCYGTTGPLSIDPQTGKAYGSQFPSVTIGEMTRVQALLLERLGITKLYAVLGGSLGGQQALEWALRYPRQVQRAGIIASGPRLNARSQAWNRIARRAITLDPDFQNGQYEATRPPHAGLATARMLFQISCVSPHLLQRTAATLDDYLQEEGRRFVDRFDANTYLALSRAMDAYDAAGAWGGGDLVEACRRIEARVAVIAISSDELYPPAESRLLMRALSLAGREASYALLESNLGHDAFLVASEGLGPLVRDFLDSEGASDDVAPMYDI